MLNERYQEALDYLYSFVDYSVQRAERYSAEAFDLARMHRLMQALGNPHRQFKSIHVAGTKGKGSVCALLASGLRAEGYRTGLYTSPHLLRFTERIQVDGVEIPEDRVADLVDRLRGPVSEIPELTTYELITALGFLHFAAEGVDCAVVEVGLGGRLDATNVITPVLSVITSISYDHTQILGDSLSQIAREKAGIVKPGVPLVSAPQPHEAGRVIESIAAERGSPVVRVGRDWLVAPLSRSLGGQSFRVWPSAEAAGAEAGGATLETPLLGHHQVTNAGVAYAALQVASRHGLLIGAGAIREGFLRVQWPGRFQVLSQAPLVVVDSAHNRDSALKLRIAIDDYFPGRPVTMIFGASADKDLEGMFAELLPRVERLILTQAVHPRAADPEALAAVARGQGAKPEIAVPVAEALRLALGGADPESVIVGTGSQFVVGSLLAAWEEVGPRAAAGLEESGTYP